LLELALLVWVEDRIGIWVTIALIVITGLVGARVVGRQGRRVWASFLHRISSGQIPDVEIAHGAMLLIAGAFLVTPGVVTDVAGLLLLIPLVRERLRLRFSRVVRTVVV
jgi:UPF0716 protein FxsA